MVEVGRKTNWWWVRHAPALKAEGTISGQIQHRGDVSDLALMRATAAMLPRGAHLVSSDLARAVDTAEALVEAGFEPGCHHPPTALWRERSFGDWEGRTYADIERNEPEAYRQSWEQMLDFCPPGGESFRRFAARIRQGLQKPVFEGAHGVVVAHDGVIRVALAEALGVALTGVLAIKLSHVGVTKITLEGEHASVRMVNWTPC